MGRARNFIPKGRVGVGTENLYSRVGYKRNFIPQGRVGVEPRTLELSTFE